MSGDAGHDRRKRLHACRVYLIVTPAAHGPRWLDAVAAALETGCVGMMQLREKTADDAALLREAARLRRLADAHGALWILNDRVHLVADAGADGAHVGEHDLAPEVARERLGPDLLLGVSAHDAAEVATASSRGADHAGLGPCFTSTSKALERPAGGAALVRASLPSAAGLPVFPIGGIAPENVAQLVAAGARRVAVGAGVLEAEDPAAAVRLIHQTLGPRP